jgi:hypothetical protein
MEPEQASNGWVWGSAYLAGRTIMSNEILQAAYTPNPGRFVWHDLVTNDAPKAATFYSELLGWTIENLDVGGEPYQMISNLGTGMGGIMTQALPDGVPNHWMAYVATDDLDACLERVAGNGGKLTMPPCEIPEHGRFAGIADPIGAALAVIELKSTGEIPANWHLLPGSYCWDELHASDPERAKGFYGEVFGWNWIEKDMGPMGTYHTAQEGKPEAAAEEGANSFAGCMQLLPEVTAPSAWMPYFTIDDADASHAKALELGAGCHVPPSHIPGVGRFTVLTDPTGATFGLISMPVAKLS